MRVYYDLETDGLLPELTRIQCLVTMVDGKIGRWHDHPEVAPRDGSVEDAMDLLEGADERVAHNGLGFDEPALRALYPWRDWDRARAIDTQVLAQAAWPGGNLRRRDVARFKGVKPAPRPGGHALKDWGVRLGALKIEFGKDPESWGTFTEEMLEYAVRDVEILVLLHQHVLDKGHLTERAIDLEHRFARILVHQQTAGFAVNEERLAELLSDLMDRREELDETLQALFPPKVEDYVTSKKRLLRTRTTPFNPGSRDQIAERMMALGWKPLARTKTGKPRIEEADLESMRLSGLPGAAELAEHFLVSKRLGQIKFGKGSWAHYLENPTTQRRGGELPGGPRRLHGRILHNGTVTHRCSHFSPNLGQVPGPAKDPIWGGRCRSVFVARPGFVLVGADASNLELRGLAHYLHRFDGGRYTEMVKAGDMHSAGMAASGMTNRGKYKERFYALIYGAQDPKLGLIVGEGPQSGAKFRRAIETGIHGLGDLIADLKSVFDGDPRRGIPGRMWLKTLDGRRIEVRSKSAILNSLLQSFGAIVMKQATVNLHEYAAREGRFLGIDYEQVAHVHDEWQLEVPEDSAELFAELSVRAIRNVTETFDLRCPLDGEAKIGAHWGETH